MLNGEPLRMLEVSPVADIFVSGLGDVEELGGGCYRFTFFSKQHIAGSEELVVVAKIVMCAEAVPHGLVLSAKIVGVPFAGRLPGDGGLN